MATAREGGEPQFSYSLGSEDLCDLVCQPCQLDGQLHEAVGLCTDCQEYLCQKCYDWHTLPTPTRNHKLLNKKQMLDSQISLERKDECSEKCPVHVDKTIKYYCINHQYLGCRVCITLDHRSCDNVRYIPHVANDLADIEEYKQAETQLNSVVEKSNSVTDDCQQKIDALEKDCSQAVNTVQEFKREITEVLDKIEADLVKSCETLKSEEMKKITQIVDKIKTAQKEVNALLVMKQKHENNKQKCNLYTVMMKAKDQLRAAESRIQEAEKEQSSINSHIRFVGNKDILTTLKKPETFGNVLKKDIASAVSSEKTRATVIQEEPIPAVMREKPIPAVMREKPIPAVIREKPISAVMREKLIPAVMQKKSGTTNVQAEQIPAVMKEERGTIARVEHVQDITVRSRIDKNGCNITGLVVLPDNRLLVTDYDKYYGNGNIKLVDVKHDQVITHLTLPTSPWDAAMITNSQVAVTMPDSGKVAIVNVELGIRVAFINVTATAMTVDRTLDMNGECRGVDYRDGKLAVSFVNPDKVQVLTLQRRVLYTITNDKGRDLFNTPYYVALGHDNTSLYVSNWGSHSVVHVKFDGTVVGTYTDRELRRPRALLTDSRGSVYVCGEICNNIHQLTADCRKVQVLLTGIDGLARPYSIGYSEAESRLYVGMYGSIVVKMYSVVLGSK